MALNYEITAVRLVPSDDQSHMHVELVGYQSAHTPGEEITITIPRVLQKMAFDEQFYVTVDGEQASVKEGTCPVCGHEPYLVTAADGGKRQRLLELRQE